MVERCSRGGRWGMTTRSVSLVIEGQVPRKSNSRQIVSFGGKPRVIKSKAALRFLQGTKVVSNKNRLMLGGKERPLKITGTIYYPWRTRGDLSGEMVLDFLVKARVISDDRFVVIQRWEKRMDKERPRAEINVEELAEWEW
jgi:Holliday junction resolvase RusA-like endonuclease